MQRRNPRRLSGFLLCWRRGPTPHSIAREATLSVERQLAAEWRFLSELGDGHVVAVEVKVDRWGNAVPRRFYVDGEPFPLERR